MTKEYLDITQGNDHYDKWYKRWRYLYHSYMGGEAYRKGEYLTKYQNETVAEYEERVAVTPLDNHCRGVISIYNSFLFRNPPTREYGSLAADPAVASIEQDADLEGRSLNNFMKDVSTYASIFGHTWVVVSKPNSNARTRAEELAQEIRPYLAVITPLNVLDWRYRRAESGVYYLEYLKYIEDRNGNQTVIKEWFETEIVTTTVDDGKKELTSIERMPNSLGMIPAICVYASRSPVRGVGISSIDDIADLQRAIYNEYSEIEQNIRLSGHPSLVKTSGTEAGAGPGAIIQMEDTLDSGLKPYLLQPTGASVESLYNSINNKVAAIDRIAHLGAIRQNEARRISGVAMESEFQQLNARLAEMADNLELAEEHIWRIIAVYQARAWDGYVEYPDSFNVRDANADLDFYLKAAAAPVDSDTYKREIQIAIARITVDPETVDMDTIVAEIVAEDQFEPHVMIDPDTGETRVAQTEAEHLALAAQGWMHREDMPDEDDLA